MTEFHSDPASDDVAVSADGSFVDGSCAQRSTGSDPDGDATDDAEIDAGDDDAEHDAERDTGHDDAAKGDAAQDDAAENDDENDSGDDDRDTLWDRLAVRTMPELSEAPEFLLPAERDLANRARPGAFIYTVVWSLVSIWGGLWTDHPVFAASTMIVLVTLSALRILYQSSFDHRQEASASSLMWLTGLILVGAIHWGTVSAWVIASGRIDGLRVPFITMLPAFAMGGTVVLGISRLIRILYPCLVFGPSMLALVVVGDREDHTLVALALCSLGYILVASRTSAGDYWSAMRSARDAGDRAQMLEIVNVTDPLTGVKNRLWFNTEFDEQWRRSGESRRPLSLVLVDLDHFKWINDTYGHLAGDECLRQVSTAMASVVRGGRESVARYGGEEFVVLLPDVNALDAEFVAQRLVQSVARLRVVYGGVEIPVRCSAGVASCVPVLGADCFLLADADAALYEAKAGGRNRSMMSSASH